MKAGWSVVSQTFGDVVDSFGTSEEIPVLAKEFRQQTITVGRGVFRMFPLFLF